MDKPLPIEHTQSVLHLRHRSGSVDISRADREHLKSLTLPARTKRWFEGDSVVSVHLDSSIKIFSEEEEEHRKSTHKLSSRFKIFDSEKGFLGRRASLMKMNLMQRRNTVA